MNPSQNNYRWSIPRIRQWSNQSVWDARDGNQTTNHSTDRAELQSSALPADFQTVWQEIKLNEGVYPLIKNSNLLQSIQAFAEMIPYIHWLLNIKGTVHPKIKNTHFSLYLYCYFSILNSFGDIGHRDFGLLSNIMGINAAHSAKNTFEKLNSNVSFQKSWPCYSK